MKKYAYKRGARCAVPADVVGPELERIRIKCDGHLTQEATVEEARPKDAPLHPAFEWNDKTAGHLYRLDQARYLIRSVTIVSEDEGIEKPVRAFVRISSDGEQSFTSTIYAMSDPELRQQVLARALKELQDWRKRYQELEELAHIFEAIDKHKIVAAE